MLLVCSYPLSSSLTDVRERPEERTIRRLFWSLAHAPTRFWALTDVLERPEERTFWALTDVRERPEETTVRERPEETTIRRLFWALRTIHRNVCECPARYKDCPVTGDISGHN